MMTLVEHSLLGLIRGQVSFKPYAEGFILKRFWGSRNGECDALL